MAIIFWLGRHFKWIRKLYYKRTGKYHWGIITFLCEDYPFKEIDWTAGIDFKQFDEFL